MGSLFLYLYTCMITREVLSHALNHKRLTFFLIATFPMELFVLQLSFPTAKDRPNSLQASFVSKRIQTVYSPSWGRLTVWEILVSACRNPCKYVLYILAFTEHFPMKISNDLGLQ